MKSLRNVVALLVVLATWAWMYGPAIYDSVTSGAELATPVGNVDSQLSDPGAPAAPAPDAVPLTAAATASTPTSTVGCVTRFLDRNYSSRNGTHPSLLVLHYTVSRNVAGTSDVNAIWSYFNRDSTDASSNYIIDAEGNCIYAVPESAKAWTQGAMNPYSISIEFIGTGAASDWTDAALAKGAQVFAAAAKRWGIPARWASAPSCTVLRSGILDHDALGCGNTHTDVGPYFPDGAFVGRVSTLLAPPPPAKTWRVTVDPYGAAAAKTVWAGIAQPAAVTATRTATGWGVLVDPNGPRGAATVWTGKYEPVNVGLPRGK